MASRKRQRPGRPSRPANGALILAILLVSGGLLLPVVPAPSALAETAWTSSSLDDFNGTGDDARIILKKAPHWVQRNPPESPAARAFGGMAAIDTDDKTVIFGGTDFSSELGETWTYDLGENRWTDMAPAGSPSARQYCQLATVFDDDRAVLFGGQHYDENWDLVTPNDTWAYDLGDNFVERQSQAFTDRSPPEPFPVTAEPAGWARRMPLVSFVTHDNISAALTYRASVDCGTFSKVRSPWALPELPDGARLIALRAFDEAGNSVESNLTVLIDTRPPEKVVLALNNGSASTASRNVRLSITVADNGSGPGEMCFSDDGISYTWWERFAPERNWTLPPGNGEKAVHIKVRDAVGNEARPALATIGYAEPAGPDTRLPVMMGAAAAAFAVAIAGYAVFRLRERRARAAHEGKTGKPGNRGAGEPAGKPESR